MSWMSVDEFLVQCKKSGDAAYASLRSLLDRLDNPETRSQARIFLSHLQKRFPTKDSCDQCFQTYHFRIEDVSLGQYEGHHGRNKLTMMVIPSIFLPEDWSFTFYEGINRHPDSIFKERTVAELGCGNGWISIAIAEKWLPSKVYGLDINPRAVKVSWINLYLNALDENGQLIYDEEKKTLLDRVEFHESDLLSYCREKDIQLERIVGCIPQALASTWWSSNITTISGNTISVATCRGVFQTGPVGKFTSVTSYNITRRHLLGVGGGTLRSSMASYWESSLSCQRATTKSFADLSQRSVVLWCGV